MSSTKTAPRSFLEQRAKEAKSALKVGTLAAGRARSKYGNRKTVVDGQVFDSQREAQRWQELRLLERAGEIARLARQTRWALRVNGVLVGSYVDDFDYINATGRFVVEDAKGVRTPVYRLKRKLMQAIHGIDIVEV